MYKKLYIKIALILVTAAFLIVPSSMLQVSHAQSNADFQNTILEMHNRERALVEVPALVWSDELAAGAQTWADQAAGVRQPGPLDRQLWREHCCVGPWWGYVDPDGRVLGQRKEWLYRRPVPVGSRYAAWSLHSGGLGDHD